LNRIAKHIFNLDELIFGRDMKFRRPGEAEPLGPIRGVELRWRWDSHAGRVFIDFFKNGACLGWRWDELIPRKKERFMEGAPDWHGIGHVGIFTFTYSMERVEKDLGSEVSGDSESCSRHEALSEYDMDSFLSCLGDDLQEGLSIVRPASVGSFSNCVGYNTTVERRPAKQSRQNSNRISQYLWLQDLLQSIVDSLALNSASDMKTGQLGTPLFVVAGSCPNRFCGMQAILYCQVGSGIEFWWLKPRGDDATRLDTNTLNKHESGTFKNVAEKAQKLYAPLADKFLGCTEGNFAFRVDDTGRAIIEETCGEKRLVLYVYLVWQESWSSVLARKTFIQGKICYERRGDLELPTQSSQDSRSIFFTRQYRIEDGRMWIAPFNEEEIVTSILPAEDFQEMYPMSSKLS